jgi:hypothetical protein
VLISLYNARLFLNKTGAEFPSSPQRAIHFPNKTDLMMKTNEDDRGRPRKKKQTSRQPPAARG